MGGNPPIVQSAELKSIAFRGQGERDTVYGMESVTMHITAETVVVHDVMDRKDILEPDFQV